MTGEAPLLDGPLTARVCFALFSGGNEQLDKPTKGAWLLAHSKSLDGFTGPAAARLENIAYAGRVGRLYNLLRRNLEDEISPIISKATLERACQLNGIDRASREHGLNVLHDAGRIDLAAGGDIAILGATTSIVLEATADIFDDLDPSSDESAILDISEKVADKPILRKEAVEYIGDLYRIKSDDCSDLIDISHRTALIDQEGSGDRLILFNSNTFRNGKYAAKAHAILEELSAADRGLLSEVQGKLALSGALHEDEVKRILGAELFKRLVSVGVFDRMEVSNTTEHVGYIASPSDFQKYGRPFEEDPVDDAKALIASLTYGQTRSEYARGQITMPAALLRKLIRGEEVGKSGVRAIGEDYKELEARQVIQVTPRGPGRYTMKLLKRDVGELALTIVRGGAAAQEALLMDGSPATSFAGPHKTRTEVRDKNSVSDRRFVAEALDRLRSGG